MPRHSNASGLLYEGSSIHYSHKGYPVVWRDKRHRTVHVLEWEKHNGPRPPGYQVHHIDGDKSNFAIDNLELLSATDHQRVHAGWVKTGGEWSHKPCNGCGRLLPLSAFYERRGYTPTALCRPCHNLYTYQRLCARKGRASQVQAPPDRAPKRSAE